MITKEGLKDLGDSVTAHLRQDIPLGTLLLYAGLFLIVAWICWDMLRILGSWAAQAAESVTP